LVEEALARDPWGFAGTGFTSARLKSDKLRMLAVNGVTPSRKTIISGAYPAELQRHLYLALRGSASPATERFLTFVLSKEGQNLLRAHGAIALTDLP
jgi:ABC-type phosphate transport system substrate-binding protein